MRTLPFLIAVVFGATSFAASQARAQGAEQEDVDEQDDAQQRRRRRIDEYDAESGSDAARERRRARLYGDDDEDLDDDRSSSRRSSVKRRARAKSYAEQIDPGIWARYVGLYLGEELDPVVDDSLWPFYLGGLLTACGGQIWLPFMFLDEAPDRYLWSAFVIWFLHLVPHVLALMLPAITGTILIVTLPIGFIPVIGFIWTIGLASLGFFGPTLINFVMLFVNAFYLIPTALANQYSYKLQLTRHAVRGEKRRRRDVRPRRRESELSRPGQPPSVAMAY